MDLLQDVLLKFVLLKDKTAPEGDIKKVVQPQVSDPLAAATRRCIGTVCIVSSGTVSKASS
jgi:hypothetical protein